MVSAAVSEKVHNYDTFEKPKTKQEKTRQLKQLRRDCWTAIPEEDESPDRIEKQGKDHTGSHRSTFRSESERKTHKRPLRIGNDSPHKSYREQQTETGSENPNFERDRVDTKTLKRIRSLANLRRETHIGQLGRRAKSDYECLRAADKLKQRADEFFKVIQSAKYKSHKIADEEDLYRETHTGTRTNISDTSIESIEKSARRGKLFVCQKIPCAKSIEPKLKDSSCQTKEPEIEVVSYPHYTQTDDIADEKTLIHVVTTRNHNKQDVWIRKPKTKKQVYAFIGNLADDLPAKFLSNDKRMMDDVDVDALFPSSKLPRRSFQSDALIKSMTNRRRAKDQSKPSFKEIQFQDEEPSQSQRYNASATSKNEPDRQGKRRRRGRCLHEDTSIASEDTKSKVESHPRHHRTRRNILAPIPKKQVNEREHDSYNADVRMKTFNGQTRIPRGVEVFEPVKPRRPRRKKGRSKKEDDEDDNITDDITESKGYSYDDVADLASPRNKTRLQKHSDSGRPTPDIRKRNYSLNGMKTTPAPSSKSCSNDRRNEHSRKSTTRDKTISSGRRGRKHGTVDGGLLEKGFTPTEDQRKGKRAKTTDKSEAPSDASRVPTTTSKRKKQEKTLNEKSRLNSALEGIEDNKPVGWDVFELKSPGNALDRPTSPAISETVPGFSEMSEIGSCEEKSLDIFSDRVSLSRYKEVIFSPGGRRKMSIANWVSDTVHESNANFDQAISEPNISSRTVLQIPKAGTDDVDETYKFSNIFEKFRNSVRSRSLQPLKNNRRHQSEINLDELIKPIPTEKPPQIESKQNKDANNLPNNTQNQTKQTSKVNGRLFSDSTNLTRGDTAGIPRITTAKGKVENVPSIPVNTGFMKCLDGQKKMAKAGTPLIIDEISDLRSSIDENTRANSNLGTVSNDEELPRPKLTVFNEKQPSSISRYSNLLSASSINKSFLPVPKTRDSDMSYSINNLSRPSESCLSQVIKDDILTSVIESSTNDGNVSSENDEKIHSISEPSHIPQSRGSVNTRQSTMLSDGTTSTAIYTRTRLEPSRDSTTSRSISGAISRVFSKLRSVTAFSVSRPSSKVLKTRSLTDTILHSKHFRNWDTRSYATDNSESGRASQSTVTGMHENEVYIDESSPTIGKTDFNENCSNEERNRLSNTTPKHRLDTLEDGMMRKSFTPMTHSSGVGTLSEQGTAECKSESGNSQDDLKSMITTKSFPPAKEPMGPVHNIPVMFYKPNTLNTIEEKTEMSESDATSDKPERLNEKNIGTGDSIIEMPRSEQDAVSAQPNHGITNSKACLTDESREKLNCCGKCWYFDRTKPWYMCSGKGPGWKIFLGIILLLLGPFIWFFYLFKLNERISSCCGECWRWDAEEYWFSCKGKGCAWLFIFIPIYIIFGPLIFVFLLVTVFLVTCCGVSVPQRKSNKRRIQRRYPQRQALAPRGRNRGHGKTDRLPKPPRTGRQPKTPHTNAKPRRVNEAITEQPRRQIARMT